MMGFAWTDEAVAAARRHYLVEGLSAAETARRIGTTRSAVIGKAHRMGWAAERDPAVAAANLVRAGRAISRVLRAPRARLKPPPPPPVACRPRPWMRRRAGECAFPVAGEGEGILSCCAPTADGAAYCEGHRAAMYVRRTEAQQKALERIAEWVDALERPQPRREAR